MTDEETTANLALRKAHEEDRETVLSPTSMPQVIRELRRLAWRKRAVNVVQAALGSTFAVLLVVWLWGLKGPEGLTRLPWWYWLIVGGGLLTQFRVTTAYHVSLARLLMQWGDIRGIGPLSQLLKMDGFVRQKVTAALTPLLPQLKASDGHLLSPDDRASLYDSLHYPPDEFADYLVALLEALEQLGDWKALSHVGRVADRKAESPQALSVQAAARRCQSGLREAERRSQQSVTLLRPAEPAQDLLRPAASEQTEEALLLRVEGV